MRLRNGEMIKTTANASLKYRKIFELDLYSIYIIK